ncbi:hypothetical protein GmHk_06G016152 [Glycine max]|nr:hypothetical protein GmHk_06G016152 [Glycine max]
MSRESRERERERNNEWVRERNSEWVRERLCLSYAGKGYKQHIAMTVVARQGEERRKNWRDASDVSSFYFTCFPKDMGEKDLWFAFKKWGDVREIFIAKNRNRSGRRYGVEDDRKLERQLDNLIIGGHKLHANLPKHGRERKLIEKTNNAGRKQHKQYGAEVPGSIILKVSYLKAVATGSKLMTKRWFPTHTQVTTKPSHSSIQLTIPTEKRKWFSDVWVGRLRNLTVFDRLKEELLWDGGEDVKPKYRGDDMVLLMGLIDTKEEELCRKEDESGLSMFHTLEKWSPTLKSGFRLVWVWGIPLHAWDLENIKKIAGVVDIDDDVEDLQRLDRA